MVRVAGDQLIGQLLDGVGIFGQSAWIGNLDVVGKIWHLGVRCDI